MMDCFCQGRPLTKKSNAIYLQNVMCWNESDICENLQMQAEKMKVIWPDT